MACRLAAQGAARRPAGVQLLHAWRAHSCKPLPPDPPALQDPVRPGWLAADRSGQPDAGKLGACHYCGMLACPSALRVPKHLCQSTADMGCKHYPLPYLPPLNRASTASPRQSASSWRPPLATSNAWSGGVCSSSSPSAWCSGVRPRAAGAASWECAVRAHKSFVGALHVHSIHYHSPPLLFPAVIAMVVLTKVNFQKR